MVYPSCPIYRASGIHLFLLLLFYCGRCIFQNKLSPVTCLLIFLAYILLYRPCGVTNVGMSVFVVFVTFLKIFIRCARWASYALVISYSPLQNFISQIEIDLSERSISRSICVPRFRSSSASSSSITLAVGR